jgi:hypothetical protein
MSSKATSIKSAVADFMVEHGISGEMEQNLVKEAIHLHLLSALSDAGVLRHDELAKESTAKQFLGEMRRFLPAKRVAEMSDAGLHQTILATSGELISRAVLPLPPE